jgi:hypothetical protein
MPDLLPVNVQITGYLVSCLPLDHIDASAFSVTVEWRGHDRWAVCRFRECFAADGTWSWESVPSEREDEWLATHRFDWDTAMVLATKACQNLTVNGITVQDVLARIRAKGGDRP